MSNQTNWYMTAIAIVCVGLILLQNLIHVFSPSQSGQFLGRSDVRGIAVEHQGLNYTLNFEQQNEFIDSINKALPVGEGALSHRNPPINFTKITVYRFNQPDLNFLPIEINNESLTFSVTGLTTPKLLMDVTAGRLSNLIASTYDP